MGTKSNPGFVDCYDIALPDEPMFVLLARDKSAPDKVLQWAYERERQIIMGNAPETDRAKVAEAKQCAFDMIRWRQDNDGVWRNPTRHIADCLPASVSETAGDLEYQSWKMPR